MRLGAFCWDFDPDYYILIELLAFFLPLSFNYTIFILVMPPKFKKAAEERVVGVVSHRDDDEGSLFAESVPGGASGSTSFAVSTEALERILAAQAQASSEANEASMKASREASEALMAALLASLPSLWPRPAAALVPPPRPAQIKPLKWSDEDTPSEFFNKYEKALKHNGVDKSEWGHVLPIYLSGRALHRSQKRCSRIMS